MPTRVNGRIDYNPSVMRDNPYGRGNLTLNGVRYQSDEDVVFAPPMKNEVLWCPGLPGQGSKLYDRSGNKNRGAITTPTWTKLASGLLALQNPAAVDFGNNASLQITNNLSVLMWHKTPSVFPTGAQWSETPAISKFVPTGNQRSWSLGMLNPLSGTLADNCLSLRIGKASDGTEYYYGYYATPLSVSTWYQLGFTFASGVFALYLNGLPVSITTRSGYATPPATLFNCTATLAMRRTATVVLNISCLPHILSGAPVLTAAQVLGVFNKERYLFGV